MQGFNLNIYVEAWPLANSFTISRGTRTEAQVVVAELSDGKNKGRGECLPYARYGETIESVVSALENTRGALSEGLDRYGVQAVLGAGAARNALDCAFWDFEAKKSRKPAYVLAGFSSLHPLDIFYTVSLDDPEKMAVEAKRASILWPRLKIKLGAPGDAERIIAVRAAVPDAVIIADANEGWSLENFDENMDACNRAGIVFVEQPLRAGSDDVLAYTPRKVPVCADESVHDRHTLPALKGKYDMVNIKLDKTGGLTEALAMAEEAKNMGFSVMAGSMVSTSLAIAPAVLLAQKADFADLDGAMLLARDRPHRLFYGKGRVGLPEPRLWG